MKRKCQRYIKNKHYNKYLPVEKYAISLNYDQNNFMKAMERYCNSKTRLINTYNKVETKIKYYNKRSQLLPYKCSQISRHQFNSLTSKV